jgi:hypothetical protein
MRTNIVIAADYFSTFAHSQALLGNVILQARACFVGSQSGDWELAHLFGASRFKDFTKITQKPLPSLFSKM